MSARSDLASQLKAGLPTRYRVIGFNSALDAVNVPTVMLWQNTVTRPEKFRALDGVQLGFSLWILVGQENTAKADDALDTALDNVLGALQGIDWVEWEACERGVLFETFQGWQVTVNAVAKIESEN